MYEWVLSLILELQPSAPWKGTFAETAKAIAEVSEQTPIFEGKQGAERTAALLVSLAWFESHFDPNATGDKGLSHGLYQQQGRGALSNPRIATAVAVSQIKASFRVCSGRPLEERLGWYAAGGPDCNRGLRESRNRILKAVWLFKNRPRP